MKLTNMLKKAEAVSFDAFVNILKSQNKPHFNVSLHGDGMIGGQWPYVMRIGSRTKSGEMLFFEKRGNIEVKDVRAGEEMAFANRRMLAEPVEEITRLIAMFFPDSRISVWDLYGKSRDTEEFRMHMGI